MTQQTARHRDIHMGAVLVASHDHTTRELNSSPYAHVAASCRLGLRLLASACAGCYQRSSSVHLIVWYLC
eukprot:6877450-Prymnesium_polylepis.1